MLLNYKLSEEDFLQAFLYHWSTNTYQKKRRKRNYILLSLFLLVIGIICFHDKLTSLFIYLVISLIIVLAYPLLVKINIENAYRKFIKQNYKEKTQILQQIELNNNNLFIDSELGKSNLNYNSFNTFIETNNYFYLNMLTSDKIIIPKDTIDNQMDLKELLLNIANKNNFDFVDDTKWKF